MKKLIVSLVSVATVLASVSLGMTPSVLAATVSAPANASISSDSVTGSSVALPTLTLSESAAGDIPVGTLTWVVPSGFVLDMTSVANVSYGGNGLTGAANVSFPDSTHFSVSITGTSTSPSSLSLGTVTPLKIKATSGTSFAANGNVLLSAGSVTGLASTTSFGLLTQVAGAASKLAFTVQPPTTAMVNSAFSATVGVEDQFGNVLSSDNGRGITLRANLLASSTLGSLAGTLIHTDASGSAVFSGLSFNAVNQINLTATSTGLASSTSVVINITANPSTTTPPTVCNLHNGILVKVAGSPTVYMVVNCVLRPFNSPAIFHAKGKKFQDIMEINGQLFAALGRGKNVGDGDDNDDTVVSSQSNTTTPPSISGLPDGAIVKLPGSSTVYMVSGGVLQPFTSLSVFKAHGKNFKDVKTISASQFASLTVGSPVTFPDGTLLRGSDHTVFVVQGGQLMGIPSLDSLRRHGWSLGSVLNVSNGELNGMRHGGNED